MTLLPTPDAGTLRRLAAERLTSRQTAPSPPTRPVPLPTPVKAGKVARASKAAGQRAPRTTAKRGQAPPPHLAGPLTLVITGPPRTKKNHSEIRFNAKTGRRSISPAPQYKAWAKVAIPELRSQLPPHWAPLAEPLCLAATVYREHRVGDLINYVQAIADVLEDAGVVLNDSWIVALDGSRMDHDRHRPRVELTLTPLEIADAA